MKVSLFPFAAENLVSRDRFGRPVPRQPAHSPHSEAESANLVVERVVGLVCGNININVYLNSRSTPTCRPQPPPPNRLPLACVPYPYLTGGGSTYAPRWQKHQFTFLSFLFRRLLFLPGRRNVSRREKNSQKNISSFIAIIIKLLENR